MPWSPPQSLLLDTNVIIAAHELGIWPQLTEKCKIAITHTVKEDETIYWRDKAGVPHQIDLDMYIEGGKIDCIDVPISTTENFSKKFGPGYLDRMDLGEAESLAFLYYAEDKWYIVSADKIVYKALGCLGLRDKGISLQEILTKIGLGRDVKWEHTKEYRLKFTLEGEQEGIVGLALKPQPHCKKHKT